MTFKIQKKKSFSCSVLVPTVSLHRRSSGRILGSLGYLHLTNPQFLSQTTSLGYSDTRRFVYLHKSGDLSKTSFNTNSREVSRHDRAGANVYRRF